MKPITKTIFFVSVALVSMLCALHFAMPVKVNGFVGMPYNAPYVANASQFAYAAGSAPTLRRTSAFTGVSDGKVVSISFWVKMNSLDGSLVSWWSTSNGAGTGTNGFTVFRHNSNKIVLTGSSGVSGTETTYLDASSNAATFVADGLWHHFFAFFDLTDNTKRGVYWDGAAVTMTWTTYSNNNLQLSGDHTDVNYSERYGGYGDVCLAEIWYAPAQYLSDVTKFRNSNGKPVSLGTTGNTPTGTAPKVYLNNPFGTFGTDVSGNGNDILITNGPLTACGNGP